MCAVMEAGIGVSPGQITLLIANYDIDKRF